MKQLLFMVMLMLLSIQGLAQTKKPTQAKKSPTVVKKTVVVTKTKTNTPAQKGTTTQSGNATTSNKTSPIKATNTAKKEAAPQPTCGYLCNVPLPYMPHKLDVLFIGNSFSIDTSAALPELFRSMNISNVNVYVLYRGASSMKQHYDSFKNEEKVYEFYRYNQNGEQLLEKGVTIGDVMRRYAYDVVVFQQYSLESGDYDTYEPYLSKLVQAYNMTKLAARTTFAFNETWAYASNYKNIAKYKTPTTMWKNICTSVKKMKSDSGIDIVIPCGTAVQNARNVELLNVDNELTRDGTHINLYAGRYLLACTFFETIIAPCMNYNLRDDRTTYGKSTDIGQVTDENRRLLQNCARLAVANNYEISEFAGL